MSISLRVNRYSAARGAFTFRGDAFGLKLIFVFIYKCDKFQKINCFEKVEYMLIYLAGNFKRLESNIKIGHIYGNDDLHLNPSFSTEMFVLQM